MIFGFLILLIAITISVIAAWYSIVGLTAIFAAAAIPVMIMGGALEAGKIVATIWLHNNWKRVGWRFKAYLIPAVIFLMLLTSMGIFGFLSKGHLDQNIISGDSQSRLALYDEKLANEQDTIANARTLLNQMDKAVADLSNVPDQEIKLKDGSTQTRSSAERALQVRRSQARDRAELTAIIEESQARRVQLQEERAPLAAEFRKIEAEVGPIKYIAALIYGDNPDQNLLEQAVRWVIIMIVIVFDPLALTLILAGNKQLEWARQGRGGWVHDEEVNTEQKTEPEPQPTHVPPENQQGFGFFEFEERLKDDPPREDATKVFKELDTQVKPESIHDDQADIDKANAQLSELDPPESEVDVESAQRQAQEENHALEEKQVLAALIESYDELLENNDRLQAQLDRRMAEIVDLAAVRTNVEENLLVTAQELDRVLDERDQLLSAAETLQNEKQQLEQALAGLLEKMQSAYAPEPEPVTPPSEFVPTAKVSPIVDSPVIAGKGVQWNFNQVRTARHGNEIPAEDDIPESGNAAFGVRFPESAGKGDMFLRVDMLPNRAYKYNGSKWIEIDKNKTDRFAYNEAYIMHLSNKLLTGEYDIDDLNDVERGQLDEYRRKNTLL